MDYIVNLLNFLRYTKNILMISFFYEYLSEEKDMDEGKNLVTLHL